MNITDPSNPYFYTGFYTAASSSCDQPHPIARVYGPCPLPPPPEPEIECVGGSYTSFPLSELEHDGGPRYSYIDRGYDNDGGDTYHHYRLAGGRLLFEHEEFRQWDNGSGCYDAVED